MQTRMREALLKHTLLLMNHMRAAVPWVEDPTNQKPFRSDGMAFSGPQLAAYRY